MHCLHVHAKLASVAKDVMLCISFSFHPFVVYTWRDCANAQARQTLAAHFVCFMRTCIYLRCDT